ncbi:hypothetical protein [Vibrio sinaloensis]|uniref:hypothetical protein n=1 Tax=Photobacterium sp. (strain ATCC 43367) TaxID=379097 RepID=UPI0035EAE0EB
MRWLLAVIFAMVGGLALAETVEEPKENAFVNINMTLELDGVERALQDTRQSLDHIGGALDQIAQSENLTPEQQHLLGDTIKNLNQLVHLSRDSVESLPSAFEQSKQAVTTESRRFLDDLQFKVMLAIAGIGIVVVLIIAAIGWFVLRPMQSSLVTVTQNISSMAGAIKSTAHALDSISNQQQDIALRLEQHKSTTQQNESQQTAS